MRTYTSPCLLMAPRRRRPRTGVFLRRQAQEAREVPAGAKTPDVAHERDQRRGGQHAHAGHRLQQRHVRQLARQRRELPFDGAHVRLEHVESRRTRRPSVLRSEHGHASVGSRQQRADARHDVVRADGNEDAELAQQAAERVESRRAGREPRGAQAMQRGDRLLLDGLDGDRVNLLVPIRLQQPFRVGAVGLVAPHVAPHVVRRASSRTAWPKGCSWRAQ